MKIRRPCRVFIDGASRGNPGPAGIGVVVRDVDKDSSRYFCRYLGKTTNNVAEYSALIEALKIAGDQGFTNLLIRTDSELLTRQVAGQYRVHAPHIQELLDRARALLVDFDEVRVEHVPREENRQADWLANQAVDRRAGTLTELQAPPSRIGGQPKKAL